MVLLHLLGFSLTPWQPLSSLPPPFHQSKHSNHDNIPTSHNRHSRRSFKMVVWYDCFVYDESRFTGIYTYIHIYTYIYTHTHTYTQWRSRLENTFYQSTCICFVFIKFYFKFCVLVVPCHVHQHHLGLITELSEVMTGIYNKLLSPSHFTHVTNTILAIRDFFLWCVNVYS